MSHERAVDDGHPLLGRYVGQCGGGVLGPGDGADVEAQCAQLVGER
ncbi:hypothetical protein [Streptomyces sp. NPDC051000]